MKQKFIIQDNELKIGRVETHMELASGNGKVLGGGWWYYDIPTDIMYLYGTSYDFGPVSASQSKEADRMTDIPE